MFTEHLRDTLPAKLHVKRTVPKRKEKDGSHPRRPFWRHYSRALARRIMRTADINRNGDLSMTEMTTYLRSTEYKPFLQWILATDPDSGRVRFKMYDVGEDYTGEEGMEDKDGALQYAEAIPEASPLIL